ncbi:hypothetical protein [Pseudoalteromonas piscicida]|nr:hypothetical protein [Pseudoalteromonas piscicida]
MYIGQVVRHEQNTLRGTKIKSQRPIDKGSPDNRFLPDFGGLKGQY